MTKENIKNTELLIAENKHLKSQIEELSRSSEKWYKTLFNDNTQAMAVCETFSDFPSIILDCNSKFRSLTNRSNEQILDKDFMDLLRKGEKHKFFIHALGNTQENTLTDFPLTFIDGQGNEINIEISTTFFTSANKRLAVVTAQRKNHHKSILRNGIEQLLSKSNQIFFSIRENDILDFDYVSQSIFKVTGYTSEQLLLNPFIFWNNCHPEDILNVKKAFKSNDHSRDNISLRFICQDGKMIWFDFSIISSPTKENHNATHYAVARENTAIQKRERQLKKKSVYDQLILQSAQSLIGLINDKKIRTLANYIGSQLQGDRFSIYIHNEEKAPFSHDVFAEYVTLNTKTYAASSKNIWEEFKDEFINLPVLLYQSDDDNFNFKERHLSFFNNIRVKSALIVPLIRNGKAFGFIASSTLIKHYRWDRTDINYLSQLSQLLSQAYQPDKKAPIN